MDKKIATSKIVKKPAEKGVVQKKVEPEKKEKKEPKSLKLLKKFATAEGLEKIRTKKSK